MHKTYGPLFIALAIVATCAFGSVAIASSDILKSDSRLALELEQQRQAAQRAQQRAEQQQPLWNTIAVIGSAIGLGLLGLWAYNWHADKAVARRRITPDASGRYAIPDPQTFSKEVAAHLAAMMTAGQMQAQISAARSAQNVPHTYAPKIEVKESPVVSGNPIEALTTGDTLTAATNVPTLPVAPSFADLVNQGFHARTDRMLLGFGVDGPIYGGIDALLSTAIAGRPGQGKSTTLRMVYAQCLQVGADVMLLDPHGSIAGDVQQGPSQLVASTGAELDDAAAWLTGELERRLTAYRAGERAFRPLLVMADEMPVISISSKNAVQALGRVVLEARKVGGYALISGQGLPASNFGWRLVRDALSSRIIHKTTQAEGLRAGLDKQAAQLLEHLQPGYAVLDGPVQPQIVAIPLTTAEDLSSVPYVPSLQAEPLPSNVVTFTPKRVSMAAERPMLDADTLPETLQATGTTGPQNGVQSVTAATVEAPQPLILEAVPEIERAQILALAKAGVSRRQIGQQLYGTVGGAAYGKVKSTLDAAGL